MDSLKRCFSPIWQTHPQLLQKWMEQLLWRQNPAIFRVLAVNMHPQCTNRHPKIVVKYLAWLMMLYCKFCKMNTTVSLIYFQSLPECKNVNFTVVFYIQISFLLVKYSYKYGIAVTCWLTIHIFPLLSSSF